MNRKKALICFTRIPQAGSTKTRLMPILAPKQCAEFHTAMLKDIAKVCSALDTDLFISYTPNKDFKILKSIFPFAKDFLIQEGKDLGSRMHNVFSSIFSLGYEEIILIGSDIPLLTKEHLIGAFQGLHNAHGVLGPTKDGGYFLVGLKSPFKELFINKSYGTNSVFQEAVQCFKNQGLKVFISLPSNDVDTPEDLKELWTCIQGQKNHTALWLENFFGEAND